MELAPSYIVLESVKCVIDDTTLNIYQILPTGDIDQSVKLNLLEAPMGFFDDLSDYDFSCVEKIIKENF